MLTAGANKTSNSYVRAHLPPQRTSSTTSLLRYRDESNSALDKLIGLCAGSGSKARIERMQEARIINALPSSMNDEFEGAAQAITNRISALTRKYKALGRGNKESITVRNEIDSLLDKLVDNPLQVSASPRPAASWAEEVGGSITGVRETLNLRTPWKEPNFGITFRYRYKEEDVNPPIKSTLPGAGSLYGDQWNEFDREVSFSHIYDPTPYDPVPVLYDHQSLVGSIRSNSSSEFEALHMKQKKGGKTPLPQSKTDPETRKGQRYRADSYETQFADADDFLDKERTLQHKTASATARGSHVVPAHYESSAHLLCFPSIALPRPDKSNIEFDRPCAQYKVLDDYIAHPFEPKAVTAFHKVTSELSIIAEAAASVSTTDRLEIPAWQRKRNREERQNLRNRAKDHRMAASPRSEMRGYNATRMLDDQQRLFEQRRLMIIAKREEIEWRAKQDEIEKSAIRKKIVEKKQLAQAHRGQAFRPDASKSIIAGYVQVMKATSPEMDGAIQAHAIAVGAVKIGADGGRGIHRGKCTKVFFRQRGKKPSELVCKNIHMLVAEKARAIARQQVEDAAWEDEIDEGNDSGEEIWEIASDASSSANDAASTMVNTAVTVNTTVEAIESTATQAKTEIVGRISDLKTAILITGHSVTQTTASAQPVAQSAPTHPQYHIRPSTKRNPKAADIQPSKATPIPIPIPSPLGASCAVGSASDRSSGSESEESFHKSWFPKRRQIQYSVGGTRMYLD